MNTFKKVTLFIHFFCICFFVFPQNVLQLNDSIDEIPLLGEKVRFLVDTTGRLELDAIKSSPFIESKNFIEINEITTATYWYKSRVDFSGLNRKDFILEIPDHRVDEFEIYLIHEDKIIDSIKGGDQFSFQKRFFNHKNFELRIPEYRGVIDIYFKARADHQIYPFLVIRSVNKFINYSLMEYMLLGLFYGTLSIMVILNLFLFISARETTRLFYSMYVFLQLDFYLLRME